MPVRSTRPGDEKPLFRAINQPRLMGPISDTTETAQNGSTTQAAPRPTEAAQGASGGEAAGQAQGGTVSRALDRAQQTNWVYPSMADAARRSGLVAKVDDLLSRLTGK